MRTVPPETLSFPVSLQRSSFGPRLAARAGDVWRAMQDVVVDQSASVGWTPERYVQANTMFVVRTMTVRHEREVRIHEPLHGRTWPSRARREMLFTREVRLFSGETLLAAATQEWAYLTRDLQPTRAGKELFDAFTLHPGYPEVALPPFTPAGAQPAHRFDFTVWHGWMDPHAHVNHAAYVDFCDEGAARLVAAGGGDPQRLAPVAETVHFRAALGAAAQVTVETTPAGQGPQGALVFRHRVLAGERVCATATTVRRLLP